MLVYVFRIPINKNPRSLKFFDKQKVAYHNSQQHASYQAK